MEFQNKRFLSPHKFYVSAAPAPFLSATTDLEFDVGTTLLDVVEAVQIDPRLPSEAIIIAAGEVINPQYWHCIRPKGGTHIALNVVPTGGGGGKNPLRSVLTIALAVAAPQLAPALSLKAGTLGTSLVTGAAFAAGGLLISAIAPPSLPKFNRADNQRDEQTLFIQGARNRAEPFGQIPIIFGRHKIVPPLAANNYTETVNNEQYVRQAFLIGYGPLHLTEGNIGDTNHYEFDELQHDVDYKKGDSPDLRLYRQAVAQNNLNVALKEASGFQIRTTPADVTEISVDVTAPNGMVEFGKEGDKQTRQVNVEVQYAPTGTNNWSAPVNSFASIAAQTITGDPIRLNPTPVFRITANSFGYFKAAAKHAVAIHNSTGVAEIFYGTDYLPDFQSVPPLPSIPSDYILLAELNAETDVNFNTTYSVKDRLNSSLVQTASDFTVTAPLAPSQIDVSSGGLKSQGIVFRASTTSAVRKTARFPVPQGQYDVRLRRITDDTTHTSISDQVFWTAIRTFKDEKPVQAENVVVSTIRVKATDQLNGAIDQYNVVAQRLLLDYDSGSGTWVHRASSNPASAFRLVLTNNNDFDNSLWRINNEPVPLSQLDLDAIEEWHTFCEQNNLQFNYVYRSEVTIEDMLLDICAAGRASLVSIDGKYSVGIDRVKTKVKQLITARNCYDYKYTKQFKEIPDAFRVQFINEEKGYKADQIVVFDDGFDESTAQNYARLEYTGVTNRNQIYLLAREHIATLRLRAETHEITIAAENLIVNKGDLFLFNHDVPSIGLGAARVKSIVTSGSNTTGVVIDDVFTMDALKNYAISVRTPGNGRFVRGIQTNPGDQTQLDFIGAVATAFGPQAGDLLSFGEIDEEAIELVVLEKEALPDFPARIKAVPHSPGIFDAATGPIPEFKSVLSDDLFEQRPVAPEFVSVLSDESAQEIQLDGSITNQMIINLRNRNAAPQQVVVKQRLTGDDDFVDADARVVSPERVIVGNLQKQQRYDFKIFYKQPTITRFNNVISEPLELRSQKFIGTSSIPPDVQGFDITVRGERVELRWDKVDVVDLAGYEIRFSNKADGSATWASSVPLALDLPTNQTKISFAADIGTYSIKAYDRNGSRSENAAFVISTIGEIAGVNAVLTIDEAGSGFAGDKTNVYVNDNGNLTLTGQALFDDLPNIDDVSLIDTAGGVESAGEYKFENITDLGQVYTSLIKSQLSATASALDVLFDDLPLIDSVGVIDGASPEDVDYILEFRQTNDDPSASPTWSAWRRLVTNSEVTARGLQFRLRLQSFNETAVPVVDELKIFIDVPDRVEAENDISSGTGGKSVTYPNAFVVKPSIGLSIDDLQTGDTYEITNKSTTGFDIEFFNSGGTSVNRTFSYIAKGGGKVIS